MSNKPETARLNFLYIYPVLQQYSDEEHPMSVQEITDRVNQIFMMHGSGMNRISSDTVKRILETVTLEIFPDSYYNDERKHQFGFEIVAVVRQYDSYAGYDPYKHSGMKRYYYMEHDFSTAEVRTLMDAVETYSYFNEDEVTDLINKLIRLRPKSFGLKKFFDRSWELREEDSLVLINIDTLNEIIRRHHCASIVYCNYDIQKKLSPRPGYPREIEPLTLMWSNGYYYLVAFNPKYNGITNFRLDRIREVEEMERLAEHSLKDFEPVRYRLEHPVMYAGEVVQFHLLCRETPTNNMINMLLDTFGRDTDIRYADPREIEEYIGKEEPEDENESGRWIYASFIASTGGTELFAMQYGKDCVIISPETFRDRVRVNLEKALERY